MLTNNDDICRAIELLEEALKNDALGLVTVDKLSDMNFKEIKKIMNMKHKVRKISSDRFITKYVQNEKYKGRAIYDSMAVSTKTPIASEESVMSNKKVSSEDIQKILSSHIL
jgi:hypothetical protein